MKNLFLFIVMFLGCLQSYASDTVILHRGDTICGRITENHISYIRFVYEGEEASVPIGKVAIEKIIYNSGRVEECSQKVTLTNPEDFDKVVVFREKEDIAGLTRIKEILAKSGGVWSISEKEGRYIKKTIVKLQKEALNMGGCAILITSQTGNSGSYFKDPHSAMTAVVYKY